ncbi:hypothetical protein NP493_1948g00003 [Ridgeia piscesae]|uniref:Uncharacterized protein n=1 Tax=Ridgeia piscesae TaxID=27915 RepID=A0AAD9N6E4_RIDPI|nr:hypothetical protein NP493_1948g00003 [Ridgeia piscesae]
MTYRILCVILYIEKVFIYNYTFLLIYVTDPERLKHFTLSVGDSPDKATECAEHVGSVGPGATVNVSCSAVGRYLTFRREGEGVDAAGLCEVVVIGRRRISCQDCPAGTSCNDVIGCDACARGKQQPDCVKVCQDDTYGVNCREECGHCKDNEPCDKENGVCTSGCEMWYAPDLCKSYIRNPFFKTTDKPGVEDITSSSILVSWPKANDVTPGLESHYYYVVWLGLREGIFNNVSSLQEAADQHTLRSRITGLSFNTNFSVQIEPFRQLDDRRQSGTKTQIVHFKTGCRGRCLLCG